MASESAQPRSDRDGVITFGTTAAAALAALIVGTVCYMEATGRTVSTGLAEAMGTVIGFYFSQLLHLTRRDAAAVELKVGASDAGV
jgi:hypothetical protein